MDRNPSGKSSNFPLSPRGMVMIIDRDATIISSRPIAYACYRASFREVIRKADPKARELNEAEFSREYHPFTRTGVYDVYYPQLEEDALARIGEVSWNFYISNYHQPEFNPLIPGMDELIRTLKGAGATIAILTASDSDGRWMEHYRIPVDGYFSVQRLRQEKIITGQKPEAIRHIMQHYGKSPREAVTIGDNPKDHIEEVISIGTPFGLDSPAARRDLEKAVDFYAPRVENIYEFFNLSLPESI